MGVPSNAGFFTYPLYDLRTFFLTYNFLIYVMWLLKDLVVTVEII